MIPILYEYNETGFTSNGIARLQDCVTCQVTEERNGVYECRFTYPIEGANFDEIQLGRIIAVTHDDTGDIQPFAIVEQERPIDGMVTFHAVHISYRLSGYVCDLSGLNNLTDAMTGLNSVTADFRISADFNSSTPFLAADGIPKSVREMLGGMEGSILDVYGGELEFDRFDVILHRRRGEARNITVRYGVNMIDYNEHADWSESYSAIYPYWVKDDVLVQGYFAELPNAVTPTGKRVTVAMNMGEYFETQPTAQDLHDKALEILEATRPDAPRQTISVDFVRLQDYSGFEEISGLLACRLCDSIEVVFPSYNISKRMKIVKTEWSVLEDRFTVMELGDLSTTLAQALGVGSGMATLSSGGGGGGSGDSVEVTQVLTTGTEIAKIAVNGSSTTLFAPTGGASTATRTDINFHTAGNTYTPTENGVLVIVGRASAANASLSVYDNNAAVYAGILSIPTSNAYGTLTCFLMAGHTYRVQGATNWTSNGETFFGFGGLSDGDSISW